MNFFLPQPPLDKFFLNFNEIDQVPVNFKNGNISRTSQWTGSERGDGFYA